MEKINIAEFEFDGSKINERIDEIEKNIEELNKKREEELKLIKEQAKGLEEVNKQLEIVAKATGDNTKKTQELTVKQNDLIKSNAQTKASLSEINTKLQEGKKETESLIVAKEKDVKVTQESSKVNSDNSKTMVDEFSKLDDLEKRFNDLSKRKEEVKNKTSQLVKEQNNLIKKMDLLSKTGRGTGTEYEKLKQKSSDYNEAISKSRNLLSDLNTQTRLVNAEVKEATKTIAAQEFATRVLTEGYNSEGKSVKQLRADRALLIAARNEEISKSGEQTEKAKALNKTIDETINLEKKLVSGSEQRFFQIGDYANQLKGSFEGIREALLKMVSGDVIGGFGLLKTSIQAALTQARAFLSTPIGAAIAVLAGIALATKALFDYNQEMMQTKILLHEITGLEGDALSVMSIKIANFASAVGKGQEEIAKAVRSTALIFGLSYEEALKKVQDSYYKVGSTTVGFLTMAQQYGTAFERAGFKAEEFYSVVEVASSKGIPVDKVLTGFNKMDAELTKMTDKTAKKLATILGDDFIGGISKSISKGEITTKDAYQKIISKSEELNINITEQQRLYSALFGKAAEGSGDFTKTIEILGIALNENVNRPLTEIESLTANLTQATEDYEMALASLFGASGTGFEGMIVSAKVYMYEGLTKMIKKVIELSNEFIELYNTSFLVRTLIGTLGAYISLQVNVSISALKVLWTALKGTAKLWTAIFTGDIQGIKDAISETLTGYWDALKDGYKGVKDSINDVIETAKNGKLDKIEIIATETSGSTASKSEDKDSTLRDTVLGAGNDKVKKKKEEKDKTEEELKKALKLEVEYLKGLAEAKYEFAKNELANDIALNNQKIKNAKILTEEMLKIEQDRSDEDARLKKLQYEKDKEEKDRKAEEERNASLLDIEQLKVNRAIKDDLILKLDAERNQKIKNNKQIFDQQVLLDEFNLNEKKKENEEIFFNDSENLKQQRRAFDLENDLLEMDNRNAIESEVALRNLSERMEAEKAELRKKLQEKIITVDEFNKTETLLVENEAKKRKEIEDILQEQKLQSIGNALSSVSQMLGETTAAGKAFGIASALINTWVGVSEVWRAPSVLPEPFGTIAKVTSTATAVMSGLNAVKNIKKVNPKGGGSTSASMPSLGSTVNTYKESFAGSELKNESGVNSFNQSQMFGGANQSNILKDAVKEGARQGAEEGSFKGGRDGIKGLSTDRSILDASRF